MFVSVHNIFADQNKNTSDNGVIVISDDDSNDVQSKCNESSSINQSDTKIADGDLTLQTLEKIVKEYNENDTANMTYARPWMDYACKPGINTISQFALYKCMLEKCCYATNSMESFRTHMEAHEKFFAYYTENRFISAETCKNLKKFRECAYCGLKAEANTQLIDHVENVHGRCIYQCQRCFYRCIEIDNMLLHQKTYHPTSSKAILLCGKNVREFQQRDENILMNAKRYVNKILCDQGKQ